MEKAHLQHTRCGLLWVKRTDFKAKLQTSLPTIVIHIRSALASLEDVISHVDCNIKVFIIPSEPAFKAEALT